MAVGLKFGIPDIELRCASGKALNPSSFAGHELIVLFVPLDPVAAAQEIAAYRHHCAEFADRDAWLLAFAEDTDQCNVEGAPASTIADPDRRAWVAFRDLTAHPEEMDRESGATFLFTRGGSLHRFWHGSGHVEEALAELQMPTSEHSHRIAG